MKNFNQKISTVILSLIFVVTMTSLLHAQNVESTTTPLQTDNSLYVVVQRSDMCTMCADNYDRWNKEIVNYYSGRPSIVFMNYDITNDKTIEDTKSDIDKYEITDLVNANKRPGRVLLINPSTKQIVKMVDIDQSTTDLVNYINAAAPMNNNSANPTK